MQSSICLCMIVKNEAKVIERCLDSVRGLVDTWVISDTGSTDGTQDLIRTALDGIPGELREEPWVNFGHNRSRNIAHARGRADYLLLLDADHVLRQDGPLPDLTSDAYMIRHEGSLEYRIKRLVRGGLPWRYEGVTHEYLTADRDHEQRNLDVLVIEDHADGGSRHDKFERDARLLGAELERDPANPRTVFYLAQTMRDMGRTDEAVTLYERRAAMGGWGEEVYYSLLQSGVLRGEAGDWPSAMDALTRAWESRPERLEACYELVARLRTKRRYRAAHAIVSAVLDGERPDDLLFMQPWVYRWGLLFEYSITAYWTRDYAASLAACDRLLALPDLPASYREQTRANRAFALGKLAEAGADVPGAVPAPALA
ncbi:tetratricopeptide repeat-containing glycosyltransferase [Streptomyces gardneri]|uniref:Glycosyl transferase n=1 Tax=Streptomyces gardneri TaxID=66892 RepID=A0A4Y3RY04_9ACTN|nr:glycosyltransferase [Streptomyces gardneri]GEB60770.1 glycosyl transferase [Streptomyces gardneri]GHH06463.1 glycosyl transferase [Streptomyces gardneri]